MTLMGQIEKFFSDPIPPEPVDEMHDLGLQVLELYDENLCRLGDNMMAEYDKLAASKGLPNWMEVYTDGDHS